MHRGSPGATRTREPGATRTPLVSGGASRAPDVGPPDQRLLGALQRSAGNRAVAAMVQREPKDPPDRPPKVTSDAAMGKTVAGVGQPPPSPVAVADTIAGTGAPPPSQAHIRGRAVPADEAEVRAAFARDPSSVVRSPHVEWHAQIFYLDKGTGGLPMAFRSGKYLFVDPDSELPATVLPDHGPTTTIDLKPKPPEQPPPQNVPVGATTFVTGGGGSSTGTGEGPRKIPAGRPSQHLAHKPAVPATDEEVAAAYRANPQSVYRSNTHYWHNQIYDLDKGEGEEYPQAFKSGKIYIVSPDYRGPATPLPDHLGESEAPKKGGAGGGQGGAPPTTAGVVVPTTGGTAAKPTTKPTGPPPQAAKIVDLPGAVHDEGGVAKSYRSTVTESGGRTVVRDRKRELGMVTTGHETSDGEFTSRTERQKGVGIGVGGNVVGGAIGTTEKSSAGEDLSVTKGTQATAGLTADGKLQVGVAKTKEFVYGKTPDGEPLKKSSSTNASVTIDPSGAVGTNWGKSYTGPSGRQTNVGGGFTADSKGNASVSANAGVTSKGGHGASVSVSAGHTVTAEDPEEVAPGVWEVRYVVSDTESVGAGVTGRAPGGVGLGVSGNVTDAASKTGSRRFKDEKEAKKFKENAAERIVKDGSLGYFPVTTVLGALSIPIGESRGVGSSRTKSGSASATVGATLSKSGHTTASDELTIRRVGPSTVHVTATVSASEGSDWGISGGLSNEKGSSESTLSAITYEFDLATKAGAESFERFAKVPTAPPSSARRVSVRTLGTQEDHDKYSMLGGKAAWSGTTWQDKTVDDQGEHEKYGGKQSHDQDPGKFWKLLGDKELHSNAQIVRSQENGKDAGARAEFKVSGESGDYNRAEFGKIFMGAKYAGDAKASGAWTLSAQVPMARIRDLEKSHPKLAAAPTLDEKMKIYSELVKEGGGRMLGGQVGMLSKAWDLELKGDENFPGERGRARLKESVKSLAATLKAKPDAAHEVLRQTGEELERLKKRREAVADPKRYTDLPDGLRDQQVALIDRHIDEFQKVRRNAQALAMARNPNEKVADVSARLDKKNYDLEVKKADREHAKLQDEVKVAQDTIGALRKEIRESSKALGDAIGSKGSTALKFGLDTQVAQVQIGLAKGWIALATAADKRQAALDPKIDQLREAWTAANDPDGRLVAVRALDKVLDERIKAMRETIFSIREAGKAVYPITTRAAMSGNPAFWQSLGMSDDAPPPAPAAPSMRL